MKIYQKIRNIRKQVLKISLQELRNRLVDIFGEKALSYYTLSRIESGHRNCLRIKSLTQLCSAFDMTLRELKEGTEEEESKLVEIIWKKNRDMVYYNENASSTMLSPSSLDFLVSETTIKPGGKTPLEQDPIIAIVYIKLITVYRGELTCHVGSEKHILKKGDALSFKSSTPHYFENRSGKKVIFQTIQNPKHY